MQDHDTVPAKTVNVDQYLPLFLGQSTQVVLLLISDKKRDFDNNHQGQMEKVNFLQFLGIATLLSTKYMDGANVVMYHLLLNYSKSLLEGKRSK